MKLERTFITHRSRAVAAPSIEMSYESGEEEEAEKKSEMSFDMTQN
jgi:hypothetical protein